MFECAELSFREERRGRDGNKQRTNKQQQTQNAPSPAAGSGATRLRCPTPHRFPFPEDAPLSPPLLRAFSQRRVHCAAHAPARTPLIHVFFYPPLLLPPLAADKEGKEGRARERRAVFFRAAPFRCPPFLSIPSRILAQGVPLLKYRDFFFCAPPFLCRPPAPHPPSPPSPRFLFPPPDSFFRKKRPSLSSRGALLPAPRKQTTRLNFCVPSPRN